MGAGARAPDWVKRAAHPVRSWAGERPWLLPLLLPHVVSDLEHPRITRETEFVVEGFPRSGNSFASSAFGLATRWEVRVSSNTHLAGQVDAAVAAGVPTLVVIRPALDAVASLCVAAPYLRPAAGIKDWLRFYRHVAPLRDGYVLASFARVTSDFGAVMDDVNARFGTAFPRFDHTPANVEQVMANLDEYEYRKQGEVLERSVARPSAQRSEANARARAALTAPKCARLLSQADSLYAELTRGLPAP